MSITSELPFLKFFFKERSIYEVPESQKNFFDITGFPHYETVWSNIYAYFLNTNEDHEFGSLFIDTLITLIKTHDLEVPEGTFEDFEVDREVLTGSNHFLMSGSGFTVSLDKWIVGVSQGDSKNVINKDEH